MKEKLVEVAKQAMAMAYAPYSGYLVGAALLCADGTIYTGCNVENASYGATICAERTAFSKAVSEGKRDFTAIAIVGGKDGKPSEAVCAPCGVCRQVMREFCGDDFFVYLVAADQVETMTLAQLLPVSFGPENLKND
mgnify:CR=1 FL=1